MKQKLLTSAKHLQLRCLNVSNLALTPLQRCQGQRPAGREISANLECEGAKRPSGYPPPTKGTFLYFNT